MDLLPGEASIRDKFVMTSREWASEVLSEVAGCCDYGSYPQHIPAFDLGRAIGRALTNCNEEQAHKELLRGLDHYYSQRG